jgi:hypothetical protein
MWEALNLLFIDIRIWVEENYTFLIVVLFSARLRDVRKEKVNFKVLLNLLICFRKTLCSRF